MSSNGGDQKPGVLDALRAQFNEAVAKNPELKEKMDKLHKDSLDWQTKAGEKLGEAKQGASRYTTAASEQAAKARAAMDEAAAKARAKAQENFPKSSTPKSTTNSAADAEGSAPKAGSDFVAASKAKFSGSSDAHGDAADAEPEVRVLPAWLQSLADKTRGFRDGLRDAAYDLVGSKPTKKSTIVRKLRAPAEPAADAATAGADADSAQSTGATAGADAAQGAADSPEGAGSSNAARSSSAGSGKTRDTEVLPGMVEPPEKTGALAIVKSAAEAWAALQEKLRQSVLIQDILAGTRAVSRSTGVDQVAAKAKTKVNDKLEDAAEAWETSQHPLVYRASSVWDSVTSETDAGLAQKQLRRLDPYFDLEEWKADLVQHLLPEVMGAWLKGDVTVLRQWLSGAVLAKLEAEVIARKAADRVMDPHILDIRQLDVVAYRMDADAHNPTLVVQFMCQQIDCIRSSAGEVVEGADDRVQAFFYMLAFVRDFDEVEQELRWRVRDFLLVGKFPYY